MIHVCPYRFLSNMTMATLSPSRLSSQHYANRTRRVAAPHCTAPVIKRSHLHFTNNINTNLERAALYRSPSHLIRWAASERINNAAAGLFPVQIMPARGRFILTDRMTRCSGGTERLSVSCLSGIAAALRFCSQRFSPPIRDRAHCTSRLAAGRGDAFHFHSSVIAALYRPERKQGSREIVCVLYFQLLSCSRFRLDAFRSVAESCRVASVRN